MIIILIVAALLIVGVIAWGVVACLGTPRNLRGFYGKKYIGFGVIAVIAVLTLILFAAIIL